MATLEAQVVQARRVGAGEAIGYGASWTAERPTAVAVLGIGYADGLPRLLSNCGAEATNNRRCPMPGRVSMDLTAIDAIGADLAVGDWAAAFGTNPPVDEMAAKANTIA